MSITTRLILAQVQEWKCQHPSQLLIPVVHNEWDNPSPRKGRHLCLRYRRVTKRWAWDRNCRRWRLLNLTLICRWGLNLLQKWIFPHLHPCLRDPLFPVRWYSLQEDYDTWEPTSNNVPIFNNSNPNRPGRSSAVRKYPRFSTFQVNSCRLAPVKEEHIFIPATVHKRMIHRAGKPTI